MISGENQVLLNTSTSKPKQRHHILYLIDGLQSTGAGAEGAVQRLCRFLPADRFRCTVATFQAPEKIRDQFPCTVHVLPLQRIYGWDALKHGIYLRRLIREQHVDILQTFFPASDILGGIVARVSGCPILVSSRRDMGILKKRKHKIPYWFVNRWCDQVQAVSERVREECIADEHLPPHKVVTIRNGVDLESIDNATAANWNNLGISPGGPIVITVANPRFVKGIDVLVQAAAIVRASIPEARFVCIGQTHDPSYMSLLSRQIADLGLGAHFSFPGPRKDVFSLLKASDLFCLPSRSEGLSNALLEAMACGLACVATDVGGNPEVISNGRNGFLVPSENPAALAGRLIELLGNKSLRAHLGKAGRQEVESRFTVQCMVDRLVLLYEELLLQRSLSEPRVERPALISNGAKV